VGRYDHPVVSPVIAEAELYRSSTG